MQRMLSVYGLNRIHKSTSLSLSSLPPHAWHQDVATLVLQIILFPRLAADKVLYRDGQRVVVLGIPDSSNYASNRLQGAASSCLKATL